MSDVVQTEIVVFESHPYWGPELQRQFLRTAVYIRECRSIHDLTICPDDHRSGLFVIDLTSDVKQCLHWFGSSRPLLVKQWPILAIGSQSVIELEWPLREAGVTEFLADALPGDDFARLCRRLLRIH